MDTLKRIAEVAGRDAILNSSTNLKQEKYCRSRLALLQDMTIQLREENKQTPESMQLIANHSDFINNCLTRLGNNNKLTNLDGIWSSLSAYKLSNSAKALREQLNIPKQPAQFMDAAALATVRAQCERRMTRLSQRISNAIRHYTNLPNAYDKDTHHGWFLVFDTLTFDDYHLNKVLNCYRTSASDRKTLEPKYRKPPVAAYVNKLSKLVTPEGEHPRDWHQYVCVPELGTQNGRFHYHLLHFFRQLPEGAKKDPNFALPVDKQTRVQIKEIEKHWTYGQSQAIACRYQGDPFAAVLGWFHPKQKIGDTVTATEIGSPYKISSYLAGYMSEAAEEHYKRSIINEDGSRYESIYPDSMMRFSSSRGFGMSVPYMGQLSDDGLIALARLDGNVSPFHLIVRENAQKTLASRMGELDFKTFVNVIPDDKDFLRAVRSSFGQETRATKADKELLLRTGNGLSDLPDDAKFYILTSELDYESLAQKSVDKVLGTK